MEKSYYKVSANGLALLVIIAFWAVVIFTILLSFIPFNPLSTPYSIKAQAGAFIPQGWSFFTRNPREPQISVYVRANGQWVLQTFPNTTYAIGASRRARILSGELTMILQPVDKKAWRSNTEPLKSIIPKNIISLYNPRNHPLMCGEYLFVSQAPIPWAWSHTGVVSAMPYKYVCVKILCR